MSYKFHAASFVAVITALAPLAASAEEVQVNQRFTAPTAHADTYAGLTLGQLVVALGLSLQGVPFTDVRRDMTRRLDSIEASPAARPRHSSAGSDAAVVATVPTEAVKNAEGAAALAPH